MMNYYFPKTMTRKINAFEGVHIPVDVVLKGDDFVISAYLPGIKAEDVDIEIQEKTVSISGEFTRAEEDDAAYLLNERPYGKFNRILRFAKALEAEKANAEMKDGVLTLIIPQADHVKAKQIVVKSN
ncbi:MAG: Hsp20/alpha crystallin family protein [Anaerolineales bacterium]|nr:Hsp20/alpha crystallin family protein [Anaerolineales bacterium]